MNDAVDRVIIEREAMDQGFSGGIAFSAFLHAAVLVVPIAVSLLLPHEPPIRIIDGFAVQLPRGGRGAPTSEPPAPQPAPSAPPETTPPEPKKPEPEKFKKPPKEEPRKGLPELDAKKSKKPKTEKTPPPKAASAGAAGGTGTSSKTLGIDWAPAGIGVPDGVDLASDWYIAAVQQRIWAIWMQQIRVGMTQSVAVSFTIQADGSLTDVEVVQSSGVSLLDNAARRAIYSAAPFGPLPKNYGTNRITIQAIFKPTS